MLSGGAAQLPQTQLMAGTEWEGGLSCGPTGWCQDGGTLQQPPERPALPSPDWAGMPRQYQVAGMGQLLRSVPVGQVRNDAPGSLSAPGPEHTCFWHMERKMEFSL